MILHFRLSVCSLGKIIVIWTMLGGRAFMEQYLRQNKTSFFFHVTSIIGVQTNLTSSSEVSFRIAYSWMVG
jgi:hypothetical protein